MEIFIRCSLYIDILVNISNQKGHYYVKPDNLRLWVTNHFVLTLTQTQKEMKKGCSERATRKAKEQEKKEKSLYYLTMAPSLGIIKKKREQKTVVSNFLFLLHLTLSWLNICCENGVKSKREVSQTEKNNLKIMAMKKPPHCN